MSKENLKKKFSEQEVTIKAMMSSAKQLEMKLSPLQDELNHFQRTNEEVMGSYVEEKTKMRGKIETFAKSAHTQFIGIMTCTNRAIPK